MEYQTPENEDKYRQQLVEQVKRYNAQLKDQEEQHKQQIIHVETIGMMTKYQLIFIKLESSLNRIGQIISQRENSFKSQAFHQLKQKLFSNKANISIQKKTKILEIKLILDNFQDVLQRKIDYQKQSSFKKIQFFLKLQQYQEMATQDEKKLKNDFQNILTNKNQEIYQKDLKVQALKNSIQKLTYQQQQDELEIQRNNLIYNQTKSELDNLKANSNKKQQSLQQQEYEMKIIEYQQENFQLNQKLSSTETQLQYFIQDIQELLQQHEKLQQSEEVQQFNKQLRKY